MLTYGERPHSISRRANTHPCAVFGTHTRWNTWAGRVRSEENIRSALRILDLFEISVHPNSRILVGNIWTEVFGFETS